MLIFVEGQSLNTRNIMLADIITISPDIQSGTPVFAKTRVPVRILFDYLKGGDTIEEFLQDYPSVKREQVMQLLSLLEKHYTYTEHEESIAR
jgi:uncharacterized protein (DUF433 family)